MKVTALLLPLALALPALAGFTPEQSRQEVKLAYGQKSATLTFATTDGSTIKDAEPLCDCTELKLEGSRLVAVVDTSNFDATVDKQIKVKTSDGQKTTLTMHFIVPAAVEFNTPSLVWKKDAAPATQEFRIRIPQGSPVRGLISADLAGEDFSYDAKVVTPGREYRVIVTPKSTARRALNRLVIKMDADAPQFRQRILYLQVK